MQSVQFLRSLSYAKMLYYSRKNHKEVAVLPMTDKNVENWLDNTVFKALKNKKSNRNYFSSQIFYFPPLKQI